jgi:hypothetical protein
MVLCRIIGQCGPLASKINIDAMQTDITGCLKQSIEDLEDEAGKTGRVGDSIKGQWVH